MMEDDAEREDLWYLTETDYPRRHWQNDVRKRCYYSCEEKGRTRAAAERRCSGLQDTENAKIGLGEGIA